jgi:hypothetical protein
MFPEYNYGPGQCPLDVTIKENDEKSGNKLFPNPTTGYFVIPDLALNNSESITIYNSSGQKINPEIITSENSIYVDLSEFANGIYFVTIFNNEQFHSIKIIKE